jgi:UDP-N-acetylmuramoyl-tripeptide--D-alanyl-D-alanine ligase
VGTQAQFIAESAERAGMATGAIVRFADSGTAANEVPRWLRPGDLVLLKASRTIHLERVAQAIIESRQEQAEPATVRKIAS